MNIFDKKMRGGDLLSEGGYGCVFHPEVNCEGKDTTDKKFVTKIQQKDFSAENEILIGEILKKNYEHRKDKPLINNFAPIISTCPIKLSKLKIKDKQKCKVFKNLETTDLIMLKIRYVRSKEFDTYIIDNKNSSSILFSLIYGYNYLLKSIALLQNVNVVHFDLKGQNIIFDLTIMAPIIIDFGLSIPINKLNDTNFYDYFYVYAPEYYVWPLEVHYLNYLLHIDDNPTDSALKELASIYVSKNAAFEGFSKEFQLKYLNLCIDELKNYNKMSFLERKNKILKFWPTWDNYSLSIIYMKFLFYITKSNSKKILKNNFVAHFTEILLLNIHPNPHKRLSLLKTIKLFNKFLFNPDKNKINTFMQLTENIEKNKNEMNKSIIKNQHKLKSITNTTIRTERR